VEGLGEFEAAGDSVDDDEGDGVGGGQK